MNTVRPSGSLVRGYASFNPDEPSGEDTLYLSPGSRIRAKADITCTATTSDGSNETFHSANAAATSGDLSSRPFLDGYNIGRSSICGVRLPNRKLSTTLQARQGATVTWGLRFVGNALLRPGSLFPAS